MTKEGTSIVVDVLVRAAIRYGWNTDRPDLQSRFHKEAAIRLMELALEEDKEEVEVLLKQRERSISNLTNSLR